MLRAKRKRMSTSKALTQIGPKTEKIATDERQVPQSTQQSVLTQDPGIPQMAGNSQISQHSAPNATWDETGNVHSLSDSG